MRLLLPKIPGLRALKGQYSVLEQSAFSLLLFWCALLFSKILLFACGITSSVTAGLVALAIVLIFLKQIVESKNEGAFILAASSLVLAIGYWMAINSWGDLSWDSNSYHRPAIYAIADGWNPLRELFSDWVKHNPEYQNVKTELFINHYGQSLWILDGALVSLLGNEEAGKLVPFTLAYVCFSFSYSLLRRNFSTGKFLASVISIILALNPVFIAQCRSYYVDGVIAILIQIIILATLLIIRSPSSFKLGFVIGTLCLILLAGAKATAFVYGLFFIFLLLAFSTWQASFDLRSASIRISKGMLIVAIVSVAFGFTWINNLITNGHPFYPLNKMDVVVGMINPNFQQKSLPEKFVLSLFSETGNGMDFNNSPVLKVPGKVFGRELHSLHAPETRFAQLGPLFSLALIMLIPFFAMSIVGGARKESGLIALVFLSAAAFPAGWWARYVAFYWTILLIVPIGLASVDHKSIAGRVLKLLSLGVATVLLLNVFLSVVYSIRDEQNSQKFIKAIDSRAPVSIDLPIVTFSLERLLHKHLANVELKNDALVCGNAGTSTRQFIFVCN